MMAFMAIWLAVYRAQYFYDIFLSCAFSRIAVLWLFLSTFCFEGDVASPCEKSLTLSQYVMAGNFLLTGVARSLTFVSGRNF